jgi:hypothetical protein
MRRSAHHRRYSASSVSASVTTCSISAEPAAESTASMPLTSSMKNGSIPRIRAGRWRARPIAFAAAPDSARAALFGRQPISSAMARIRCRVCGDTPGRSLRA